MEGEKGITQGGFSQSKPSLMGLDTSKGGLQMCKGCRVRGGQGEGVRVRGKEKGVREKGGSG